MSSGHDFDGFVDWVNAITIADGFEQAERTYKLELAEEFGRLRDDGFASDRILDWLRIESNNIVGWRTKDAIAKGPTELLGAEVEALVGEGDLGARLDRFASWLEREFDARPGEQISVASNLLMGSDPIQFPPYKTRAIARSLQLTGRTAPRGPVSTRYQDFLGFCDEVANAVEVGHSRSIDRLDVQGACWVIGGWPPDLVAELLPDRHDDFERWRSGGRSPESSDGARESSPVPRWWVNQGETYLNERDGSYIWAPQETKAGYGVGHHTAVKSVLAGDRIVHYADGHIRAIGTAIADGVEADRPGELPEQHWQRTGFKAEVVYDELEQPVALREIPEELRRGGDGPFTSSGGVKQGYLFELSDEVGRGLVDVVRRAGGNGNGRGRLWVVYVGLNSMANLEFSLPQGRWGWKRTRPEYDAVEPGDFVLFAAGYTGGSPRVAAEEFRRHGLERVAVCRAATRVYHDARPFWPDEDGEDVSYPYRVDVEACDELGSFQVQDLDARFGAQVGEAIRLSAINQGRAEMVEVDLPQPVEPTPFDEVVAAFVSETRRRGLSYGSRHDVFVRSFVTALATKPFVILTGLSGSGKTQLAKVFGDWLGAVRVVAVRPDWTSPDMLLGFENGLSDLVDGRYAWNVPETLRFILQARDHPSQPHLLLLDEMNLAHVERYFADVLSGMESGEPIIPDLVRGPDGNHRMRTKSADYVRLPENLFVVGTVNIDETTYMFSPKVLDRANTFEFRVATSDLNEAAPNGIGTRADEGHVLGFLETSADDSQVALEPLGRWLRTIHEILSPHNREFGHRTFQEALRFASLLERAGETAPLVALDLQISQKVLPRLHGSRRELGALLNDLAGFCFVGPEAPVPADFDAAAEQDDHAVLPISYDKLHRMARKLQINHFVSYAE